MDSSSDGIDGNRRENGGPSSSSGAHSSPPSSQIGGAGAGSWARDKLRLNFDSDVHPRKSPKLSGRRDAAFDYQQSYCCGIEVKMITSYIDSVKLKHRQ